MTGTLTLHSVGPALSVQDLGRPGFRAQGLTQGGAADQTALYEGAALLGQPATLAALEMAGSGGSFSADVDLRIALTGAQMTASIDDMPVVWNASHTLPAGATPAPASAARSGRATRCPSGRTRAARPA